MNGPRAVTPEVAAEIRAHVARQVALSPPPALTPEQAALIRRIFARPRATREAA